MHRPLMQCMSPRLAAWTSKSGWKDSSSANSALPSRSEAASASPKRPYISTKAAEVHVEKRPRGESAASTFRARAGTWHEGRPQELAKQGRDMVWALVKDQLEGLWVVAKLGVELVTDLVALRHQKGGDRAGIPLVRAGGGGEGSWRAPR